MKTRAHVFVNGSVQGVFFRSYARSEARLMGLKGWVKNLADGRVESVIEGDKYTIEQFIKKLKHGPPKANVENVSVEWQKYGGRFKGFEIHV